MNLIKYATMFLVSLLIFAMTACGASENDKSAPVLSDVQLKEKANDLAKKIVIIDGHIDLPYRLRRQMDDISTRTTEGDFDYVRARAGGLNAPFMSIYIPAKYQKSGGAKNLADSLIDMVYKITTDWPDKFAVAASVADVKKHFKEGLMSLPMGMENGAPIEGNLENLRHFYKRGIRYITLTHSKINHLCDSSYDKERQWNGLSPFGKKVIVEMNKLGIMIDVSHVTDSAFYDVIKLSKTPVIASHSSCRKFTPGWERNMNDDMIKLMAEKGGVINITFGSTFLNNELRKQFKMADEATDKYLTANGLKPHDPGAMEFSRKYRQEHGIDYADISQVIDHIDHVVKIAGINHVGLGSDFEGVGDELPNGLKDVSQYPNLIYHLLKRGYSEEDIEKICGGNMLRVWSAVENAAG